MNEPFLTSDLEAVWAGCASLAQSDKEDRMGRRGMTAYAMRTKSLGVAFLLILSGMASLPITQAFGDEFDPYIKVQMGDSFMK